MEITDDELIAILTSSAIGEVEDEKHHHVSGVHTGDGLKIHHCVDNLYSIGGGSNDNDIYNVPIDFDKLRKGLLDLFKSKVLQETSKETPIVIDGEQPIYDGYEVLESDFDVAARYFASTAFGSSKETTLIELKRLYIEDENLHALVYLIAEYRRNVLKGLGI